jgi:PhnB protein
MKIPGSHQTIMPYLIVDGAEKFIDFTKKVFNAEEIFKGMREDGRTVMHAEIQIGSSTIMFADTTDQYKSRPAGLFIYVEDADETYKTAIARGATIVTELSDQDYGRTGGVADPFGNTWWITSVK